MLTDTGSTGCRLAVGSQMCPFNSRYLLYPWPDIAIWGACGVGRVVDTAVVWVLMLRMFPGAANQPHSSTGKTILWLCRDSLRNVFLTWVEKCSFNTPVVANLVLSCMFSLDSASWSSSEMSVDHQMGSREVQILRLCTSADFSLHFTWGVLFLDDFLLLSSSQISVFLHLTSEKHYFHCCI